MIYHKNHSFKHSFFPFKIFIIGNNQHNKFDNEETIIFAFYIRTTIRSFAVWFLDNLKTYLNTSHWFENEQGFYQPHSVLDHLLSNNYKPQLILIIALNR